MANQGNRRFVGEHSGFRQYLVNDPSDEDSFAYELVADVEPTLEFCHAMQTDGSRGYSQSGDIQHLGRYPRIVFEIAKQRWGADPLQKGNEDLLMRLLNDPDLSRLRTGSGWV